MADVEKININSTDYDIADAKALRNKSTTVSTSFVDSRAGNTTYPTTGANLNNSIIIGKEATVYSDSANLSYNTVIGNSAKINSGSGANTVTLVGASAQATGDKAVVMGYNARGTGGNAIAIGTSCNVSGSNSISIGNSTAAASSSSVVVGYGSGTTPTNSVAVGCQSAVNSASAYGTVVGSNATIGLNASNSTIIGAGSKVNNYCSNSIAIGRNATVAQGGGCIQLGTGTNTTYGSFQVKDWTLLDSSGIIPPERLPIESQFATNAPFQIYNINGMWSTDNDDKEYAILYTGETNSAFTRNLCYKSTVNYSYPSFACAWANNNFCNSPNDIIIDQQKLFEKFAEISKERIDDDDLVNSVVGGDNASQSIYFYYNGDSQIWYIEFGSDSFESGSSQTPDGIYDIDDISDFGIYLSPNVTLPTDDSDEEIFDIEYYAPVFCDGFGYNDSLFKIDYMKFMNEMQDGDWGFNFVDNFDSWSYEVDGTTYYIPILPKEYYTDDGITIRFEWGAYGDYWTQYINGDELEYSWSTAQLASNFGIYVDEDEEQSVEYIEINWKPARQLAFKQFNPIKEDEFATASDMTTAQSDITTLKNWCVKTVTGGVNLDNYTDEGWYKFVGSPITNKPTAVNTGFTMLVIKNGIYTKQFIFAQSVTSTAGGYSYGNYAPSIFHRCCVSSVWSGWQTVYSGDCANFISGFDSSKKQKLVHNASTPSLSWAEDTGSAPTYDSSNERITW